MQAYKYHSFANVPLITKFSHTNKPWATQESLKTHHAHKTARRNSTQPPLAHPYLHGVNFFKQPLGSSLIFQQCIFSAPAKRQLLPRKTWALETHHSVLSFWENLCDKHAPCTAVFNPCHTHLLSLCWKWEETHAILESFHWLVDFSSLLMTMSVTKTLFKVIKAS